MGYMLADQDILTEDPDLLARALTDGILCFIENVGKPGSQLQADEALRLRDPAYCDSDPRFRPLSKQCLTAVAAERALVYGLESSPSPAIIELNCRGMEKSHRGLVRPLGKRIRETVRGFESHLLRSQEPAWRAFF